ncbi:thiamine pyrophosphate-dependent dehydrogenase E1 component subunit alpha [Paramagnetospirillum marisnigri]|nr:thiamine pyrophosphate-dependent dehydrogenase E1 component subunit alpha [Paramagnetospirillum marisnigri]
MAPSFLVNDQLALFRSMLRIRLVEEAIATRYAEQEMRCPVHLSIGQEAVATGVCLALRPQDQIVSTHRSHAHYLAKGGDLNAMLAEIYGKETGCCGGRGGSMHLFDAAAGILASLPIVGSAIGIATGAALAFQQEGSDCVAVTFPGDASVEEGIFHESLNFAALMSLPVVYVIENNLYACFTGLEQRQPHRPLGDLALAHGLTAVTADGNDVEAIHAAAKDAIAKARDGGGPSVLVFNTYRWREHCGPNYDNNVGYRSEEEFQQWKARCPVESLQKKLMAEGQLSDQDLAAMTAEIEAEVTAAFQAAKAAPFPLAASAEERVYA